MAEQPKNSAPPAAAPPEEQSLGNALVLLIPKLAQQFGCDPMQAASAAFKAGMVVGMSHAKPGHERRVALMLQETSDRLCKMTLEHVDKLARSKAEET